MHPTCASSRRWVAVRTALRSRSKGTDSELGLEGSGCRALDDTAEAQLMIDLLIRDARIAGSLDPAPVDVHVDGGVILEIVPASAELAPARTVVEATGALLSAPYVEPHIHLDAVLTAGEPRWNESGTLWEGIACWSERKACLLYTSPSPRDRTRSRMPS